MLLGFMIYRYLWIFGYPRCDPKVEAFSVERAQSCDFVLMAVSGAMVTWWVSVDWRVADPA